MQPHKMRMSKKKFRIGELSKELKLKKFVIRFWEKEFALSADRSEGGQRYYTQDDLMTFQTIKDLLYRQGYTIAGAKKCLAITAKRDTLPAVKAPSEPVCSSCESGLNQFEEPASESTPIPEAVKEELGRIRARLIALKKSL